MATDRDRATAAAAILTNMKGDDEAERKQERKKKRKEVIDALVVKRKARKDEARKQFFSNPKERVLFEGPISLIKPCEAAIRRCIIEGVEVPAFLKSNPRAAMPDPVLLPRPLVAPAEDDNLLMVWPDDNQADPERANDTTDLWFFDDVEVVDPKPGERKQLGWYCASKQKKARRLPNSAIRKKPKNKPVVMKINIKQPHDEKTLDD